MKKILLVLLSLLLIGCQSTKGPSSSNLSSNKEDLILKEWKYLVENGTSTQDGYYFMKNNNKITYISYYDYESKQEVYLCQKPECQHIDETCYAYMNTSSFSNMLFTYKDHLYIIQDHEYSINALGESERKGPCIIQMDLDGQNRKELFRLDDGYTFEYSSFALADDELYIPIVKTQDIEMKPNEITQVITTKKLCTIHLQNAKQKEIIDFKGKDIIGVQGRQLIISVNSYDEDPQAALDRKDYEKYDKLIMFSKVNYEIYDIDTQKTKTIEAKHQESGDYYQNKIYFIENNQLLALDIQTEKTEKIIDLPTKKTFLITMIVNDYIVMDKWENEMAKSYKISLKDRKLEKLNQYTREPKEPVRILAKTHQELLVVYDREGHVEKSWAGTMQYETTKEYIGLISIEDFLNNKKNYQTIKTLTKMRDM